MTISNNLYWIKKLSVSNNEKVLYLTKGQIIFFGLTPGQSLELTVGFNSLIVDVAERTEDLSSLNLYLSSMAFAELTYYQGQGLCLIYMGQNRLVLGLTLAMSIPFNTWKKIERYPVIKGRAQLALKKGIIFYCICPDLLEKNEALVEAYCLDSSGTRWENRRLPFPQIIYTRSAFPRKDFSQVLWVNDIEPFEKWRVYQVLNSCLQTKDLQPETALLSLTSLERYLTKYQQVFVKNIYGRCGRQVMKVENIDKKIICKTGGTKVRKWTFASLPKLYKFLNDTLGSKLLIQQGLSLARIDGCPFDMRVLVQKDINGRWQITAVSLRIAAPQAIVTNIAAGAKELAIAPGDSFPCTGLDWELINSFCLKVLEILESSLGTLGEVGLDVALDTQGRLWLIEANSQPSSRGYLEAARPEVCDQIFGLPLDYGRYLASQMY